MSKICQNCGTENIDEAKFCRKCGMEIYHQNCTTDEIKKEAKLKEKQCKSKNEIGFVWWKIWAWIGLTWGNLSILALLGEAKGLAIVLIIINTILMILTLRFNKYAFLIGTIISIAPLFWIVNGIYLKNRWNHPKVNNGKVMEDK